MFFTVKSVTKKLSFDYQIKGCCKKWPDKYDFMEEELFMGTKVEEQGMSLWKKISYAMSSFGGNMAYVFITYYFLYFCTD